MMKLAIIGITCLLVKSFNVILARINDTCDPNYELPLAEENECNFPCSKGVCRTDGESIRCVCDPHALQPNCINTCCKDCGEFGICAIPVNQNEEICVCSSYFTGEFCDILIQGDPCDLELPPISFRECENGLTCIHGICNETNGRTSCICENGASGPDCSVTCCKSCGFNGACIKNPTTGSESCLCSDSYTGERCETFVSSQPSDNSTAPQIPNVTPTRNLRISDVCDPEYEKPSPEDHECFLPCFYGTCRQEGGLFGCECDINASGSLCSGKCCKNCGEYGKCVNAINDIETCECHRLFSGEFCDIYVPRNVCDSEQSQITPEEPLPIQICSNELTCVYGKCNSSSTGRVFCSCDPNAFGVNCSQKCCLDCGEHGTCVLNNIGQESCSCQSPYTGTFCEIEVSVQPSNYSTTPSMPNVTSAKPSRVSDVCDPKYEKPSPEEHECFFPCVYGTCRVVGGSYGCACDTHASGSICSGRCCKNCGEYGKCVPAVNDQEVCECHPLFTGEFCEVYVPRNVCDSEQTQITPQEPLPIQTCSNELTCVYGRCNISSSGASICSCDPGAYGANCSQACCLDCGEHGTCVLNSTGEEICRCKSSYTGVLCETKVARITDVCHPNYTRPPSDEQECFACLNGLCRKRDIDTFECECDENAYDLQCSRKCCKSCGIYGICVISLDDTQVCECHPLFTGEFCDVYVSRNVCDTEQTYVNKPLVPLPIQICSDELVCVHGICNTSEDGPVFCICDPGAYGVDCNQTCCLDCGQYGVCVLDTAGNETCECEDKYSGEYCDVLVITQPGQLVDTGKDDDDNDWVYWVVGACILVILLLILVTFIVLYIMWKRRVILVMKVVHYFQEYEDGDNRQWDALITVQKNSLAEEFAISTLCPKLEKEMGFNVSIRYPTEAKSEKDEIVRAAEKSRRTIIVVSPKNMFIPEFKAEKLKQIHDRSKVITILLEDTHVFKDTVNEDLKTVFGNAMQIQWPRSENPKAVENFWKRLELCMPKKKRKHKYSPITNSPVTLLSMKTHLNGETDKRNLHPDSVILSV